MSLNNTKEEQELYDDIVGGLIGEEPTTWSHDKVLEFMANLVDVGILTSRDLSYAHAYTASCSGSGGSIGDVFECVEDSAKALFGVGGDRFLTWRHFAKTLFGVGGDRLIQQS